MRILYYPKYDGKNYAVKIFRDCLADAGNEVVEFDKNINMLLFQKFDFAYIQWYENLPSAKFAALYRFVLKLLIYYILRLKRTRVIYVMHNKVAHDMAVGKLSMILLKFILKRSDKIVILSDISRKEICKIVGSRVWTTKKIQENIFKIPHPNYINVYPPSENSHFDGLRKLTKDKFTIMCMGMVRPYKNLDLLIDAYQCCNIRNSSLIIVGNPQPKEYGEYLKKKANGNPNIYFHFQFVDDDHIGELLSIASIMAFPYNHRSCLNSGAIYLAFSFGKTIISPLIGTVMEFGKYSKEMYIYDYKNMEEHMKNLSNAILSAYHDWTENKNKFILKGRTLFNDVSVNNSPEKLIERYKQLYL